MQEGLTRHEARQNSAQTWRKLGARSARFGGCADFPRPPYGGEGCGAHAHLPSPWGGAKSARRSGAARKRQPASASTRYTLLRATPRCLAMAPGRIVSARRAISAVSSEGGRPL